MGLIAGIVNESLHHKMIIIESVHEFAKPRVGENMTTWRATWREPLARAIGHLPLRAACRGVLEGWGPGGAQACQAHPAAELQMNSRQVVQTRRCGGELRSLDGLVP